MQYAKLDSDNNVLQVIECEPENIGTQEGVFQAVDPAKNAPRIGGLWDAVKGFIDPKPFPSWILDDATGKYSAPIACPGFDYKWDEGAQKWLAL